jgi:hypothetical protein
VAQARARGLKCYASQQEAQQSCREPEKKEELCWVCVNGRVSQLSATVARGRGLQCYSSQQEAQRNCQGEITKPTAPPRVTPTRPPFTRATPSPSGKP